MNKTAKKAEIRLEGIGVSPGVCWGPVEFLGKTLEEPENSEISRNSVEAEKARLSLALIATRDQIIELQSEISSEEDNESHVGIFDAHLLLLEDSTVLNEVLRVCETQMKSIDWAYYSVVKRYIDSLRKISDPYLRERAVDIEDVAKRVLKNLSWSNLEDGNLRLQTDTSIILAHNLTPSDTVGLNRSRVKGFATEVGSATSHTAIMARSLNIPAVVALHQIPDVCNAGDIVLVDGYHGRVILNPAESTLKEYGELAIRDEKLSDSLSQLKGHPTTTADGKRVTLSANIEFIEEIEGVKNQDAEGIGLYRTEFFYLQSREQRSEEFQFGNYKAAAEATGEHGVIIRTLDIGGDKLYPELIDNPEPNPFLGWRGIRLSLDRPGEFRIQLRAILRASAFGKVRVMFPFISTLEELQEAKVQLELAKSELRDENTEFDEEIEVGAMIEIPSAVLIADHLAREVDFFSIGTNDLVQYTTAVDRVNDRVASLYQPTHPAVVSMIKQTVEAAHRNGIWCGICGEAASDLEMTPIWVGLGVDELSVGSAQLLRTRRAISTLDSTACGEWIKGIAEAGTAKQIQETCHEMAKANYPELLL
ncbi:MAG: phosphoenolpyruvate--protein phosphotransferase [Verrucomicrobiales bacterium]|nr:phosphoenolpyruvate--protein phosphotransferase [Verrucomicrobiales bacterium]